MWIQNVAAVDVTNGHHVAVKDNSMLIQIMDPASSWWPTPKHQFKEVHQFEFLDAEDKDGFDDDFKISDAQAAEIVGLLQHALDNRMDVIVHCMAGLCRSGAVCEIGVMMGFDDTERFRSPNLRVKHRMMKALGWTYDPNEPFDEENWRRYNPDF
jgi:predicted protein tyrosine phosphatase